VLRCRSALRTSEVIEIAIESQRPALSGIPETAHEIDGFAEGTDSLARHQPSTTHRLNRVPERAGPERKVQPASGQQVKAGSGAGQDSRRSQWQIENIGGEVDALCLACHPREQRPGIQERWLVGVVLKGHQVIAKRFAAKASATTCSGGVESGVMKVPNFNA
jgi:hypothetical protein